MGKGKGYNTLTDNQLQIYELPPLPSSKEQTPMVTPEAPESSPEQLPPLAEKEISEPWAEATPTGFDTARLLSAPNWRILLWNSCCLAAAEEDKADTTREDNTRKTTFIFADFCFYSREDMTEIEL